MRIELGYPMFEGCWTECALCGEGFVPNEVEARTMLPGEYCQSPVCRRCALASEEGLRQRLRYRAAKLRLLAETLEVASGGELSVPTLGDIHALEKLRTREFVVGSDEEAQCP